MNDVSESLGDRADQLVAGEIRAELARQRKSQAELAGQLGVSRPWLSRRLSGETPLSIGDVVVIAGTLGVSIAALTAPVEKNQPA
jgi:transcriptional regulator with XRE-family HTH domain